MRIIQVTPAYKPAYIYGGPTMSVAKLCEALALNEVDLEVLTTTANGKNELPVHAGEVTIIDSVKVTYFNRLTKDHTHFSPALLGNLRKKILDSKNGEPVIVHIHAWWNLVSIFCCLVAKRYKIPVVLSPRGMLTGYTLGNRNGKFKTIIHDLLGKKLLQYCHIHATSEQEEKDVLEIIKPKSITVIPNIVSLPNRSTSDLLEKSNDRPTSFKLIFLSRIEQKKGIELLFEALFQLKFDWTLTIAGNGDEEYISDLKRQSELLQLSGRINWVGHINNENKFNLLAAHDLFVLTSHNENFANVVIESLSCGTPVLLSNRVGLSTYVEEKKLGWICSLEPTNIAQQIISAFEAKAQRSQINSNAPERIYHDFSAEHLTKAYRSLYEKIVSF